MGTIVIGTIVGIVFIIFSNIDNGKCVFDNTIRSLGGGCVGFVIGFFIALALPVDTVVNTYECEIIPLRGSTVDQDVYLEYGKINDMMEYRLLYEMDGDVKLIQIKSSDVTIKFSDAPKLVIYKEEQTNAIINSFAFGFKDFLDIDYKILIPEKYFKRNYTLTVD